MLRFYFMTSRNNICIYLAIYTVVTTNYDEAKLSPRIASYMRVASVSPEVAQMIVPFLYSLAPR